MRDRIARLHHPAMFVFVGLIGLVVGVVLQAALVRFGVPVLPAYIVQLAVTLALNYELNRRLTYRLETHSVASVTLITAGRVGTVFLSIPVFVYLTSATGMHVLANVLTVCAMTGLNYTWGQIVFRLPPLGIMLKRPIKKVGIE